MRGTVVKPALIRQVKSMSMACDPVGNLLLAKFSYLEGKPSCLILPSAMVFWLLEHMPVNTDPNLRQPPAPPQLTQYDWDDPATPRALTVKCKDFPQAIRMSFELDRNPGLVLLLDPSNVELMRQIMAHYHADLMNLDA